VSVSPGNKWEKILTGWTRAQARDVSLGARNMVKIIAETISSPAVLNDGAALDLRI
jgi:hypothetical protein